MWLRRLRSEWEEGNRKFVLETPKADVGAGRPAARLRKWPDGILGACAGTAGRSIWTPRTTIGTS